MSISWLHHYTIKNTAAIAVVQIKNWQWLGPGSLHGVNGSFGAIISLHYPMTQYEFSNNHTFVFL